MADRDSPLLYLASASPRRRELLSQVGVSYECWPVDIDERVRHGEPACGYVIRMALEKAQRAAEQLPATAVVLGADTAVVCDDAIFGKPRDRDEAMVMLRALSGRTHRVMTAVAVGQRVRWQQRLVVTEVSFRALATVEMERYWATGEPAGKAGGYAIQGLAAAFITGVTGSYSSVVGLPLAETVELLREFGVAYWQI